MISLIEKIKKFFSRKEKQYIEPYDETMYIRFIDKMSEYAKELCITTKKIGPIENPFRYTSIGTYYSGTGECFFYGNIPLVAIYPHNLCIKWNPLDENKFVLIEYDIERGKQMLLEQIKDYKLYQQHLKEERMKADFE